jgi:very-short-patch-repair endonuclease
MRASPTPAERKLSWQLRHRIATPRTHFRHQVRIARFVADFRLSRPSRRRGG